MRTLDWVHRWTGAAIGLLLALLGLSGTLLLYKTAWLRWTLPHAADAQVQDGAALAAASERLFADPSLVSILMADEDFGLHRLTYADGTGAYADQAGNLVVRWTSVWDRFELWLFEFHHYLLLGEAGGTVAALAGLVGIFFVVSGVILWWRSRRKFRLSLLPRRSSRGAILHHHRDLGLIVAPLLTLSMLTGAMLTLRPVSNLLLSPLSSAEAMAAATAPPAVQGGPLGRPDWRAIIDSVRAHYPDAEIRSIKLPTAPGGLISLRARQPEEWLPNGRTLAWFDPADGRLVDHRDALAAPAGSRIFNNLYPLHSAKVGGIAYKLVMTASGLALTALGSLAVFTFWASRRPRRRRQRAAELIAPFRT